MLIEKIGQSCDCCVASSLVTIRALIDLQYKECQSTLSVQKSKQMNTMTNTFKYQYKYSKRCELKTQTLVLYLSTGLEVKIKS